MNITFIIGSLDTGGAERQLTTIAIGLAKKGNRVAIITLYPGGAYYDQLHQFSCIKTYALVPRRNKVFLVRIIEIALSPWRLRRILKVYKPDYIYSMLHETNLIAWFSTRGLLSNRLVWGIRSSFKAQSWKQLIPERLCAALSPTVPLIIANSYCGLEHFKNIGYNSQRSICIHNGIDTEIFYPSYSDRNRIRAEFKVEQTNQLIGIVARLDPLKDHVTFLHSAKHVKHIFPNAMFVCVGDGPTEYKHHLVKLTQSIGLDQSVIWLGSRSDIAAIYNALDVLVSTSISEGFSNVIGEAMACGTPCVVTNVGDSSLIVGKTGVVVEPKDPIMTSHAICAILNQDSDELGYKAHKRINNLFSVEQLINNTEYNLGLLAA